MMGTLRARVRLLAVVAAAVGGTLVAASPASAANGVTYDTSFGFNGPAGLYAYGMDYDPYDGTILVGDYWNYRVWRYTTSGQKIGVVSKPAAGGLSGGSLAPYDVEADTTDPGPSTLWVADQGSSRIVEFSHSGAWIRTIGKLNADQNPGPGGQNYAFGCGGGKMQIPTHILVDPARNRIHVSDPRCREVYTFNHTTGAFIGAFDWSGSGIGVPIPRGIAQDDDGRIYVVEHNSRSIAVFNPDGNFLYKSAAPPAVGADRMNDPRGLDIDRTGNFVYVVGAFYNKVYQFKINAGGVPTYVKRWSNYAGTDARTPPAGVQKFDSIRFPAVDDQGNVYVGETWGCASYCPGVTSAYGYGVVKFDPQGTAATASARLPWATGPQPPPKGGFNQQNGIAINPADSSLFVVDTFEQRVQKLDTTKTCTKTDGCPAWVTQWGSREPSAPGSKGFGYPRALTFGADGLVWVGDNNNAVLAFRPDGTFVHRFGSQGKGRGQFSGGVQGIRVTSDRVYATDVAGCRLQVFDRAKLMNAPNIAADPSALIDSFGSCGTGANQMTAPRGIAVDGNTVYVAETGTSRISRWNLTTGTATQVRLAGACALAQPWGITWDPSKTWLYIGSVKNARIVRWNPATNACQVVVTQADLPAGRTFLGSNFVEFDSRGRLYASDNSRTVYRFNVAG
jgi:tripartite motif-containing protein 71